MKAKAALLIAVMLAAAGSARATGYVLDKGIVSGMPDLSNPRRSGAADVTLTSDRVTDGADDVAALAREAAAAEARARCERADSSPRECYGVRRLKAALDRAMQREQWAKAQALCGQAASFGCHQIRSLTGMRKATVADFERIRRVDGAAAPEEKVVAFFAFVETRTAYLEEQGAKAGCEATPEDLKGTSGFCAAVATAEAKQRAADERRRQEMDAKATAAINATVGVPEAVQPVDFARFKPIVKQIRAARGRPVDACPTGSQGWVALGTHDACVAGKACVCRYDPNFSRDAAEPLCPGGKWERLGTKASCASGADCVCSGDLNVHR